MPGIKTHCLQSAITSAAVYPFIGAQATALIGISIVMVDIDHVMEYIRQTGSLKIWGVFPCCKIIDSNLHRGFYVLNLFHTVEFMLIVGLLGLLYPPFFYVLAGALWHFALDLFLLVKRNYTFKRALSVVEYSIRDHKPGTILRVHDLLRTEGVTIPNDSWNYPAWIKHWQHCKPLC